MTAPELAKKYAEEYKTASHRRKAEIEKEVWDITDKYDRQQFIRRAYLQLQFGEAQNVISMRETLFNAGSAAELLWRRIEEEGMLLSTAVNTILREAKRKCISDKKLTLERAVEIELALHDQLPVVRMPDGREFRRRSPSSVRRELPKEKMKRKGAPQKDDDGDAKAVFGQVREILHAYMSGRIGDAVDPIMAERLWIDFGKQLNALLLEFRVRVYRIARQGREDATLFQALNRRDLVEACKTLKMDPPRQGKPVDMAIAKKRKRSLARIMHPDARGGDQSMSEEFEKVVKAFELIEQYNASLSASPAPQEAKVS